MGTKITFKGKSEIIDLPRGAAIPREGDVVRVTKRREKKEKSYTVYLVEHTFDFNLSLPIGSTLITLEEIKNKKSEE
ncbi:hypothetical protein LCGC14_1005760 [marine sediment metagenome]|uniref:Uncharacterized protein n=1 Tax=marine sediment metagenome TaxID=412755 RepID=A0A0F9NN45_9ZZZZ